MAEIRGQQTTLWGAVNPWVQIISQVGFPAVMAMLMGWLVWTIVYKDLPDIYSRLWHIDNILTDRNETVFNEFRKQVTEMQHEHFELQEGQRGAVMAIRQNQNEILKQLLHNQDLHDSEIRRLDDLYQMMHTPDPVKQARQRRR